MCTPAEVVGLFCTRELPVSVICAHLMMPHSICMNICYLSETDLCSSIPLLISVSAFVSMCGGRGGGGRGGGREEEREGKNPFKS